MSRSTQIPARTKRREKCSHPNFKPKREDIPLAPRAAQAGTEAHCAGQASPASKFEVPADRPPFLIVRVYPCVTYMYARAPYRPVKLPMPQALRPRI